MSKPARKGRSVAASKVRKVRGRPITEVSRAVLEDEVAKLQDTVENLQDTVRWHNQRWRQGLASGGIDSGSFDGKLN